MSDAGLTEAEATQIADAGRTAARNSLAAGSRLAEPTLRLGRREYAVNTSGLPTVARYLAAVPVMLDGAMREIPRLSRTLDGTTRATAVRVLGNSGTSVVDTFLGNLTGSSASDLDTAFRGALYGEIVNTTMAAAIPAGLTSSVLSSGDLLDSLLASVLDAEPSLRTYVDELLGLGMASLASQVSASDLEAAIRNAVRVAAIRMSTSTALTAAEIEDLLESLAETAISSTRVRFPSVEAAMGAVNQGVIAGFLSSQGIGVSGVNATWSSSTHTPLVRAALIRAFRTAMSEIGATITQSQREALAQQIGSTLRAAFVGAGISAADAATLASLIPAALGEALAAELTASSVTAANIASLIQLAAVEFIRTLPVAQSAAIVTAINAGVSATYSSNPTVQTAITTALSGLAAALNAAATP